MTSALRPGDPRRLGGYELLSRLGEGGMGTVYLGRATEDDPLVAIKVIKPEYASEDEFRARFRSEVTRARQVPPFCTAAVLDADPEHVTPYLVVEFVDGPSLAEVVLEQGPLTAGNLHSVAIGVATALVAIHGAGVIHRDLKPRNVLFALGTPKVIDFGIARAFEATSQHTRTDQMVGTVAYMAPERFDADSRSVTAAADVFAWGAVVAYAGTGRTPFAADSAAATAARILTQPPELSGLPGPLRDLVALSLAKEPEDRPSAHELLELLIAAGPQEALALAQRPALRRAAEAAQHSGRHSTGDQRRRARTLTGDAPPARRRRRGWLIAAAAAALVLTTGGGAYALLGAEGGGTPAPELSVAAPAARQVRGPSITDPLDRPGQWTAATEDGLGGCEFEDQLVATAEAASEMRCAGPKDSFGGDQSIAVDVTVRTPGSCALIWFRWVEDSGYRLSACETVVKLVLEDDGQQTPLTRVATSAFTAGRPERLRIDLRGQTATVSVAGRALFQAPITDPGLVAGRVVLGVATETFDGPAVAGFADVEILSLPAPGPDFTDVSRGDTKSVVRLLKYDSDARSVVVEPAVFLPGEEFCAKFRIPGTDPRCEQERVTEDSRTRSTLPVSRTVRLLTFHDGEPECLEDEFFTGTCRWSPAKLTARLKDDPELLVMLTTDDGTGTSLAEVFQP